MDKIEQFDNDEIIEPTSERFQELNDLEEASDKEFDEITHLEYEELPIFMQFIIRDSSVSPTGAYKFMKKFSYYYLKYKFITKFTNDCVFLFIEREYIGCFKDKNDAINAAFGLGFPVMKGVYTVPMSLFNGKSYIYNEYNEISHILSNTKKVIDIVDIDKTTKKEHEHEINESFNINLKYNCQNSSNELFLFDSGASITTAPHIEYINPIKYEYSNFPYLADGTHIIDEEYRKDFLLNINEFILGHSIVQTENAFNLKIKKQIFFKDNFHLILNDNIKIDLNKVTCPHFKRINKQDTNIKKFMKYIPLIVSEDLYERPEHNVKLLGLNVICKLKTTIEPVRNNLTILTIENAKIVDKYEVFVLSSKLELFACTYKQLNSNFTEKNIDDYEFIYGLSKDFLYNQQLSKSEQFYLFESIELLSLIMFSDDRREKQEEIKNIIDDNVDGYIIRQDNYPYCLSIHLKNNKKIVRKNNINFDDLAENRYIINNDYQKLCSWFI